MKRISIILAGGKGERFWPLTRISKPKQILPLTSNNPMILDTYNRLSGFDVFYVVANSQLCTSFKTILPENVQYIVEAEPRNTAPAIGLACAEIMRKHGDCIIFFETADHYYSNPSQYISEINKACEFAEKQDKIVLIGINPTKPHIGYGYIQIGDNIDNQFYSVKEFKEKPDRATAQNYLLSGNYLWNAGIYVSKCSVLIAEIKKYLPNLKYFIEKYLIGNTSLEELTELFHKTENTSIDYGMLEKSLITSVMKTSFPWEDIGDFNSLKYVLQCDEYGNFYKSTGIKISSLDSNDNIIITEKKIALIGIKNIAVVETPDVLFICKRSDTQKIKQLLESVENEYK